MKNDELIKELLEGAESLIDSASKGQNSDAVTSYSNASIAKSLLAIATMMYLKDQ